MQLRLLLRGLTRGPLYLELFDTSHDFAHVAVVPAGEYEYHIRVIEFLLHLGVVTAHDINIVVLLTFVENFALNGAAARLLCGRVSQVVERVAAGARRQVPAILLSKF